MKSDLRHRKLWMALSGLCSVTGLMLLLVLLVGAEPEPSLFHVPQRIVLSWTDDPARTQAVTWRTQRPVDSPKAQIAAVGANPGLEKNAVLVPAVGGAIEVGASELAGHYEARFENLQPGTAYAYRVGDGVTWSPWYHFHTAAAQAAPFRFLYFGDAQNNIASLCSRVFQTAFRHAPDARFMLHAGDLVNDGYDDHAWGEWCAALGFISAWIPCMAAAGNHDWHQAPGTVSSATGPTIHPLWRAHLALPLNGPDDIPNLEETSYYFDYQGIRVVCVDSNLYANDKLDADLRERLSVRKMQWLRETLQSNPHPWVIVMHHHPIYSVGKDRDNARLREALLPVYDEYAVDLVLQGHDHYYARTHKLRGGEIVDADAPGTVYAISVSGPKMYTLNRKFENLMAVLRGETQMFQIIEVEPTRLIYKAYTVAGECVDAFELRRNADGHTVLQNLILEE